MSKKDFSGIKKSFEDLSDFIERVFFGKGRVKSKEIKLTPKGRVKNLRDLVEIFRIAQKKSSSKWRKREFFIVASFNEMGRVISVDTLYLNSPESGEVPIKYIISPVLREDAPIFAVCHIHSLDLTEPSLEDIKFTRDLKEVSKLLGLKFLDHIILTEKGDYFSFTEAGRWVFKELGKFEKEKQKEKELEFQPLKPHMTDLKNVSKYLRT
jgi:DNA repair protein RadC